MWASSYPRVNEGQGAPRYKQHHRRLGLRAGPSVAMDGRPASARGAMHCLMQQMRLATLNPSFWLGDESDENGDSSAELGFGLFPLSEPKRIRA
jgi:hypothetical protein